MATVYGNSEYVKSSVALMISRPASRSLARGLPAVPSPVRAALSSSTLLAGFCSQ